ncbi:hypothetical protein TSAR_008398 [Trichomalopsis sarcophagae]|uniref:Protoporphyrinogen oxidase n=1 Tax=Trichomalopsis sarcophagae TaxID=543379 RepID=A0A232F9I7_9HYME|nr:hypothetical protein TSAR_008398 [Trichomalopsis sarcophagae]
MTAILGGGISGLSAAYYAVEHSKLGSIVLYEASNRLGGWIRSVAAPSGVIFEKGPRTIRSGGAAGENTLQLISDLNLSDKVVAVKMFHPAAKNRLIYVNEKLHLLPNSLGGLLKIQEPFKRRLASIIWTDLRAPKEIKEDESIYSFVERRMGKDVADYLISPMICGICAGDAKQISVNFLLKSAFEFEQKHGSMTKGLLLNLLKKKSNQSTNKNKTSSTKSHLVEKSELEKWSVWGLRGGLEQFPIALNNSLKSKSNLSLRTKTNCEQITFKPGQVELSVNGKAEKHLRVVSSLSAKSLAPLLKRQHPQLSRELEAIPCATVAVVNLHFNGDVLPLEGFGFLVPPSENLPILGVIFDSCVFSNKNNTTVLTVMMGGAWFDKYFGKSVTNDQLLSTAVKHTKNILKIQEDPVETDVAVLKDCIPQYVVGHSQRMQRIQNYISSHKIPLVLCGSSYHGVGLNDVILSAKRAISDIV